MTISKEFLESTVAQFQRALLAASTACGERAPEVTAGNLEVNAIVALASKAKEKGNDSLQVFLDQFYERRAGVVSLNNTLLLEYLGFRFN